MKIVNEKFLIVFGTGLLLIIAFILLTLVSPKGYLQINSSPDNAKVVLGRKEYPTGQKIKLKPGKYSGVVKKSGYENYYLEEIEITKNRTNEQNIRLITPEEAKMRAKLPIENLEYKIEYSNNNDTYTVSLFAILNSDSQLESYKKQLVEFKKAALGWIIQHKVDPNALKIEWLPEDINI